MFSDLLDIEEVRTTDSTGEVNRLLQDGWDLIGFHAAAGAGAGGGFGAPTTIFVMARVAAYEDDDEDEDEEEDFEPFEPLS